VSEFQISVLMPTKPERAAMFQEALASVHAQTLDSDQVEIVSRCSSRWYPEKVNDLARSARGQFVIMLADDDRLRPGCLAAMLAKATETGAHVVSANVQNFHAGGWGPTTTFDGSPWTFERFRGGPPIWITSLVDRAKFLEAGGLNFTRLQYADWALWYELWKLGVTTSHIGETLWDYRDHPGQASKEIDAHACRAAFFAAYPELFP
jgi:glycosyltransferase involved in cell wall biosynthesis